MKRMAVLGLCAAVVLALLVAPAWADETKGRMAYPKSNDPVGPLPIKEPKVLSRNFFCVPPFFSEEVITTEEGVKKITTFLLFIRVESEDSRPR